MLLRVSASNFLSIADRQELSLVATKLKGPEVQLMPVPGVAGLQALPSAVMYGPNASGKSNFIAAFAFMRHAVLQSHSHTNPAGGVPRIHFALDDNAANEPTEMEVDFVVEGSRYQYGFQCNNDKFISEWLYSFPEGKRRKLFERNQQDVDFGQHFKGAKKILVDLMRPNSLFVSTATQNDHEELTKIASFFRSIEFCDDVSIKAPAINHKLRNTQIDDRTIKFLGLIETGIVGYREQNVEISDEIREFSFGFLDLLKKAAKTTDEDEDHIQFDEALKTLDGKMAEISLAHSGPNNKDYYFSLERESAGTRRLVFIMNIIFKAIDQGAIVAIDELDASLHTFAVEQILKVFSDPLLNKNGAQLIATTHDTNLLNSKFLRRDQVWFVEKNKTGASAIYPLSDIKSRQSDNFEQGYLEGRYGAVPFSGDLHALLGDS